MDYRLLLKKYIEHVGRNEGTDFLDPHYLRPPFGTVTTVLEDFTPEEWAELNKISQEGARFP